MSEQPPDSRIRRWRRLRAVAVSATAAMLAPLGAVVLTPTAASAAPVTLTVSGEPVHHPYLEPDPDPEDEGQPYTFAGAHYSQLRTLLTTTDFGEADFEIEVGGRVPRDLDGTVDVYVGTGFSGGAGYNGDDTDALLEWIESGGVYIGLANGWGQSNVSFLPGAVVGAEGMADPPAKWGSEPELPDCQDNRPGPNDCYEGNPNSAPTAAEIIEENRSDPTVARLIDGVGLSRSHGVVDGVRLWHTVSVFHSLPTGAIEVAEFSNTCDPEAADCSSDPDDYENTISGTAVAVVPFGTADYGDGAVFIASDLDVFANQFPFAESNRTLALNTFQWIGDHFTADDESTPPPPPPPPPTTTTPPVLPPGFCSTSSNPTANPSASAARGYWFLGRNGDVFNFGNAANFGSLRDIGVTTPAAAMSARADGTGYWIVDRDGIVHGFGAAAFHGDMHGIRLNSPIIALEPTPSGNGYWLLAGDGGVFSFGDAAFYGSTGNLRLNAPIISMRANPAGGGYWLLASDGGVFSFGNAPFHGSTGNMRLNAPVLSMAVHPSGNGYWLLGGDGGVFSFGSVQFRGSVPGIGLCNRPTAVQIRATATGNGYYLLGGDGGVFSFGDAFFHGANPGLTGANAAIDLVVRP